MTSLAPNPILPRLLRWQVMFALNLLPVTLAIAASYLGTILAGRVLGLLPDLPIALQVSAFAGLVLGFVLLALRGGWRLNQICCRWLLGWPSDKVRAVFHHSDVPRTWIKASARARGRDLQSLSLEACEGLRQRSWVELGLRGALHALIFAALMTVFTLYEHPGDWDKALASFGRLLLICAAGSLIVTVLQQRRLRAFHRRLIAGVQGQRRP